MATCKRALHFVFKIGNRKETAHFYRDILGMKILRHEEFEEGCKASCNGPYDGKWSKSMVGYGAEDEHFVVELTYNYGLGAYVMGDDFCGITIHSTTILPNAQKLGWPLSVEDGKNIITAPDGYKFIIVNESVNGDPVRKVSLACSNLSTSIGYWRDKCAMQIYEQTDTSALLGYSEHQCKLELICIGKKVDHGTAFGRIAFACPSSELPDLEKKMKETKEKIITPLVSLDTPGKATVQVVILADPDDHEICFVGDEAFRELSQVDPNSNQLLDEALEADKSDEWFAKKGKTKGTATA